MIQAKNKITLMQYILLIHSVQMGVGVLTLPRVLAEKAGTDGWISILICWVLTTAASLLIVQIMKRSPNGTILDLITSYFGKWIGKLSALLFALYFAFLATTIFIREALFIGAWILPFTEEYMLLLLLSIPSYLIIRKNISILSRYGELVFFMTLWTVVFYVIPLKYGNWLHLLPVFKEGWEPIVSGVQTAMFSFTGFEIAFFLYPYLQNKNRASMGIVISNTLSLFAFLLITIGAFIFYSPDEITIYNEPTINIFKVLEFKFIERLEIVFFSFYIFVMSTTVLPLMYFTVFCTSQLLGKKDHSRHAAWYLLLVLAYVVIFPPTFERNTYLQHLIDHVSLVVAYLFPLLLWGYVWLHGIYRRSIR